MVKMQALYQGEKHCQVTHGPSGAQISTDAPKDNQGKGENFSPTDLVGAALSSCMLTIMAMAAEKEGIKLQGAVLHAEKEMLADPRRVGSLKIRIELPKGIPRERRAWLETVGLSCPVAKSLHPELKQDVQFVYPD